MQTKHKENNINHSSLWTLEEEQILRKYIQENKKKNWTQIAQELQKQSGHLQRTGKQCRQRYMNFIKFEGKRGMLLKWSPEEQQKLFKLYQQMGSKWVLISHSFENKSENCLKNKFYGSVRKLVRKLNSFIKSTSRIKKQLKYESILKPLEYKNLYVSSLDGLTLSELKNQILQAACTQSQKNQDGLLKLIDHINHFNMQTRSAYLKKSGYKKNCIKVQKKVALVQQEDTFEKRIQSVNDTHSLNLDINEMSHEYFVKTQCHLEGKNHNDQLEAGLVDYTFYEIERSSRDMSCVWLEDEEIDSLIIS